MMAPIPQQDPSSLPCTSPLFSFFPLQLSRRETHRVKFGHMGAAPLTTAGLLHKALGEMLQWSFFLASFHLLIPAADHLHRLSLMRAEGSWDDYIPETKLQSGNTGNLGNSMQMCCIYPKGEELAASLI